MRLSINFFCTPSFIENRPLMISLNVDTRILPSVETLRIIPVVGAFTNLKFKLTYKQPANRAATVLTANFVKCERSPPNTKTCKQVNFFCGTEEIYLFTCSWCPADSKLHEEVDIVEYGLGDWYHYRFNIKFTLNIEQNSLLMKPHCQYENVVDLHILRSSLSQLHKSM